MEEKALGLPSLIATGAGVIVATSCLLAIGQGVSTIGPNFVFSMAIACLLNMTTALTVSELNAIMPRLTGGVAQYTLACLGPFITIVSLVGGYIISLSLIGGVEGAMFGNTMALLFPDLGISKTVYGAVLMILLIVLNLRGLDIFAKVQDAVAYALILSLIAMGLIGCFNLGRGVEVTSTLPFTGDVSGVINQVGLAFYMFVGCEFIVSLGAHVKNPRRNIPLGMILSLLVVFIMQAVCVFGFSKYVPQDVLANTDVPHILYGIAILGDAGRYWMGIVSILAVVSTVNTVLASLSYILSGMSKIRLLPSVFMRKNKQGAPYAGILLIGTLMLLINVTGLSASSAIDFFMLVASALWIVVYLFLHISVLSLRVRLPKVPRTFKMPLGGLIPVIGILGDLVMLYGIDETPAGKLKVYAACLVVFAMLAVYAFVWLKTQLHQPFFKPVPVKTVMAMEDERYHAHHPLERQSKMVKAMPSGIDASLDHLDQHS